MNPQRDNKYSLGMYGDTDLHKAEGLLYSDKPLSAKMISDLMHVETTLSTSYDFEDTRRSRTQEHSFVYYVSLTLVSVLVALSIGLFFSYAHELGPFHNGGTPFSFR